MRNRSHNAFVRASMWMHRCSRGRSAWNASMATVSLPMSWKPSPARFRASRSASRRWRMFSSTAPVIASGPKAGRSRAPKRNRRSKRADVAAQSTTLARRAVPMNEVALPAFTLWWREVVRFYRQRTRVIGVIASPLVFWLVIGSGFGTSFRSGEATGQQHYLDYFYPGALIMIVLFTSIFTMMSVIEDRKEGFLLSVLVAPVPRSAIVLGKVLGGTTLSAVQGLIFLVFAPFVGVHLGIGDFLLVVLTVFLVSFSLTALGFAIAWPMDSTQAFHAIINLFLIPLWLLSGALFPLSGASGWIRVLMRMNPLTYGVEALRNLLYPASPAVFPLSSSMATLVLFSAFMFGLAFIMLNRRTTEPAAC